MSELSPKTIAIIEKLFAPSEHDRVATLLRDECGNNLPFLDKLDEFALERFRFAALKISDGDFAKLQRAVQVAKEDWRDLLMGADFGQSLTEHDRWAESIL
jgi:hypothetical protein